MRTKQVWMVLLLAFALVVAPAYSQDPAPRQTQSSQEVSASKTTAEAPQPTSRAVTAGKQKMKGVIVKREADGFIMRDEAGGDLTVKISNSTSVREKKGNPFRSAKRYSAEHLVRGLMLEVEGRGDGGVLVAEKIRVDDDDLMVARTVESRVTPVEGRVGEAETRLAQSEQNAQRLSGQIEELSVVSNAARGGAKAAQATADAAMAGADAAITGVNSTNERITSLDDYEPQKGITVNFKVGSATLSEEAKAALDQIATDAKAQKGFVIEVTGFASADGSEALNRQLSRRRADAVVQYLAENHDIPLRRIITPFGYGELKPVADNKTREGRKENRRVEVKILVSRGLTNPTTVTKPPAPPSGGNGTN